MRALPPGIVSTAHYSDCKNYRYALVRIWDSSKPLVVFLMLNPSTATEFEDDPTVAKCRRYAMRWGFGQLAVLNLFAWRSTDPAALRALEDPIGPHNNYWIFSMAAGQAAPYQQNPKMICAWGKDGNLRSRASFVTGMLRERFDLYALKVNGDGTPAHPLYLKESLDPIIWRERL
jgi:hypothetical protein